MQKEHRFLSNSVLMGGRRNSAVPSEIVSKWNGSHELYARAGSRSSRRFRLRDVTGETLVRVRVALEALGREGLIQQRDDFFHLLECQAGEFHLVSQVFWILGLPIFVDCHDPADPAGFQLPAQLFGAIKPFLPQVRSHLSEPLFYSRHGRSPPFGWEQDEARNMSS